MVSITSWLDPILNFFADKAGLLRDEHNAYVGGEIVANLVGKPTDFLAKGFLNKLIHFVAGLIAAGYGVFGKDVPPRLRRELIAFGEHELWKIVDLKPEDIAEIQRSLSNFIRLAMAGDWTAALSQVLTTPTELAMALGLEAPQSPAPQPAPPVVMPPPPPPVEQVQAQATATEVVAPPAEHAPVLQEVVPA
jgi:hypothetical protein